MKRWIAMLLALALTLSLVPATALPAFAEEAVIEETIPDEPTPEETEPQETEPEVAEPQETEPEVTEPEVTEPEETEPEESVLQEMELQEVEPEVIDSGRCGRTVNWALTADGILTISGTGAMGDYLYFENSRAPWDTYEEQIHTVIIEDGLTDIGEYAFYELTKLTSVSIPDSVTRIGNGAFSDCSELTSVTIPDSITLISHATFSGCTSLASVSIPDSVTRIDSYAFSGCTSLTSISIPDSVTSIHEGTFQNCTSLASVTIPDSVTSINEGIFQNCTSLASVTIPDSVTSIGSYAFYGCTSLTSVTIPDSVTTIGANAFSSCTNLASITFCGNAPIFEQDTFSGTTTTVYYPAELTVWNWVVGNNYGGTITWSAYGEYTGDPNIITGSWGNNLNWTFVDGVLTISGSGAMPNFSSQKSTPWYNGQNSIASVVIEEGVTSIGNCAFQNCTSLTSVTIPRSVITIGQSAFNQCRQLSSVYITDLEAWMNIQYTDVASGHPFSSTDDGKLYLNGTLITDLVIPDGVTTIKSCAFYRCTSLTSVTIPDSVTTIGANTFDSCKNLASVAMGESVATINNRAFGNCTNLTSITFCGNAPAFDSAAFSGTVTTVYYPAELTNWNLVVGNNYGGTITWSACGEFTGDPNVITGICGDGLSWTLSNGVLTISGSGAMPNFANQKVVPWYNGRSSITSVVIKEGVTSIGSNAFYGCTNLNSVVVQGSSLTTIGEAAFRSCSNLEKVTLPDSITFIGRDAFSYCKKLGSIKIPAGVTQINADTFLYCTSFTSVVIPEGVTVISSQAFYGCTNMTSITIPASLTSIGTWAFNMCDLLESVYITDLAAWMRISISDNGHSSPLIASGLAMKLYLNGSLIKNLVIPDGITSINPYAFAYCSNLTSVTIPDSVTSIGNYAFCECSSLTSVTIPKGLTSINLSAFDGCTSLTSVSIPDSVTSIDSRAFYNCTSLKEVFFYGDAPSIFKDAFTNVTATAYYPPANYTWNADTMQNYSGSFTWEKMVGPAANASGICGDNLLWQISGNTLLITGQGRMYDYTPDSPAPWSPYIASIRQVDICQSTSIGTYAFAGCTELEEVNIHRAMHSIGAYAFSGCGYLSRIYFNYNAPISVDAKAFTDVTATAYYYTCDRSWSDDVWKNYGGTLTWEGIASDEFFIDGKCGKWVHWELTGDGTLYLWGEGRMYDYTLGDTPWAENAFLIQRIIVDENITYISNYAFAECENLVSVSLAEEVEALGEYAFSGCTNLETVCLPDGLKQIGQYAFSGCSALKTVSLPEELVSLGAYAFSGCKSIPRLDIHEKIQNIGAYAFQNCTGVTQIHFNGEAPTVETKAFRNITANAYYPDLDSWTVSKQQNYGGSLSWHRYTQDPVRASGTWDNLTWQLSWDGVLTVTGSGAMPDQLSENPWRTYAAYIQSVQLGDGITHIGDYAFYNCYNVTSVTIPDSVVTIGDHAFQQCKKLTEILLPAQLEQLGNSVFQETGLTAILIPGTVATIGNNVFLGCVDLTDVTLEEGIQSIGEGMLCSCVSLVTVTFPQSLTSMDTDYTFTGCSSLEALILPACSDTIGESMFAGCDSISQLTIPEHITTIGPMAFDNCYGFTELTIPDSVTTIQNGAFGACVNLKSITLPAVQPEMGEDVFAACLALEQITIPEGWTNIPHSAFTFCESLKQVSLPSTLQSIGNNAFDCCYSLTDINIPDTVTSIGLCAFRECSSLAEITLPSGLTEITESLFDRCVSLRSMEIPAGVTRIRNDAFSNCTALEQLVIPDSVTQIGSYAFVNCPKLTQVVIPEGVTQLAEGTFMSCRLLAAVTIPAQVQSIGYGVFEECRALNHVLFTGTQEQWDAIAIDEGNTALDETILHCNAQGDEVTAQLTDGVIAGYCTICECDLEYGIVDVTECELQMITEAVYTGSQIYPEIILQTSSGRTLVQGQDFTVTSESNKYPGRATLTITGMGDCIGSFDVSFSILPEKVKNMRVSSYGSRSCKIAYSSVPIADYYEIYVDGEYWGSTSKTSYTLSDLTIGRSYCVNVIAVVESGYALYCSAMSDDLYAKPGYSLNDCKVSIGYSTAVYDGTQKCPAVTVKTSAGKVLTENIEYEVQYINNTDSGEAQVKVSGINNYNSTVIKTFIIEPDQVTGLDVTDITSDTVTVTFDATPGATEYWVYQGTTRKARVQDTVYTYTGLTAGKTYKFSVKAVAVVEGDSFVGDASITVSAKPTYTIEDGDYVLTLTGVPKVYNGSARIPTVKVKAPNGKTLTKGTDYTLTWQNNTEIGTATVTVTGAGKYSGTLAEETFEIVPGRPARPSVQILSGTEAQVSYSAVAGAQWYEIYVNGELHGKTDALSYTVDGLTAGTKYQFTVCAGATVDEVDYRGRVSSYRAATPKHSMNICTVSLSQYEYAYTGKSLRPAVTVYGYEGKLLTEGEDYSLSYRSNKNTGSAYVTVEGEGAYTDSVKVYFTINPAQVAKLKVSSTTTSSVKVSWTKASTNSTKYYNVYVNGEKVGRTTAGNYTIKGLALNEIYDVYVVSEKTVSGTTYYGTQSDTIEVWPGTGIGSYKVTLEYTKAVYEGAPLCPSVVVKSSTKASAVTLVQGVDYTVEYVANNAPGKMSVIIRGIGVYTGTITKTITVSPAKVTGVTATATGAKTIHVEFDEVAGATEYWVYVNGTRKAKVTETSCDIAGLTKNKTYKVTVKAVTKVGTTNYAGALSDPFSVKTLSA